MRLDSRGRNLFETTDFFEAVVNWLEQHCGPVPKTYAVFSSGRIFTEDIGYLIFIPTNLKVQKIKEAKSFKDLASLLMLGSDASGWEKENIPPLVRRESYIDDETRLQVLARRQYGDYLIMGLEQLKF